MKIILITPRGPTSRTGNQVAATRWARILRQLGHQVRAASAYDGRPADLMVAVHAWRSAAAIAEFKAACPDRPVVLQLSGTDIYDYISSDPGPTLRAMAQADRLVALNDLAWRVVPRRLRARLTVIHQSAAAPRPPRRPSRRAVVISVIGHLRDVKDPLRAAAAARLLPADSRVIVEQVGSAYTPQWAALARQEMAANPRYAWRGDVPPAAVRRLLARSHAMVISSFSEGGANVVSEAAVAGVPILASRMDGNVGLLGADYPGYFPVGDTTALAGLLRRIEDDPGFVRQLTRALRRLAPLFNPARELAAWRRLLAGLAPAIAGR
ncbi:selenoneine biosynthesis selenosugar synthase SenB [Vineibacter terrae]|uniref:selenoneine biosynthesis selenosugar synthase SenB n=1 Tax=Vineibacter terrae TaxID=2586908 RepID=UPI002E356932|nr:selenoneine biosynthesis selenosugar synthase SenB [Vineibacter terrae]HEX2886362.1 selenoneine biosynthesis selenosugar synthase SenB [Vineibacter terrae]